MMSKLVSAVLFSGLLLSVASVIAEAAPKRAANQDQQGYAIRRGGYSYNYGDTINTYGGSRTVYGGGAEFRDPTLERQTEAGPFDHGFFFDSAIGQHGGNAPYMH
ncbi:hypothetical protein [Hyphomicrobium sp.]|jgi:hypothetical protein|uniref:hypothetical protein n=1 Tax=Hyphomicrobium sp. TaxID=82 RepID=UPI002CA99881|nr:hypothetical protein [Hyphomicrobium sp.]HVZ03847.1 hypothetical protein [Hyphomicrobium sp.]